MKIDYAIKAIETKNFDINYDNYDRNIEGSTFDLQTNYFADDELFIVKLSHTLIIFQAENAPIATLEVDYTFKILEEQWQELYNEDGALIIPQGLVMVFYNIAIGTTRGILHAKLEKTPFSTYYIPPVVLQDAVKSDLSFEFKNED
ncbi:MAG: hypothetical protein ACJATI_001015 [Halioglobus sp.]|jgi:hypothetical protein